VPTVDETMRCAKGVALVSHSHTNCGTKKRCLGTVRGGYRELYCIQVGSNDSSSPSLVHINLVLVWIVLLVLVLMGW